MSKAFTKEDDDGGFAPPRPSTRLPAGPFLLTATGARHLSERGDEATREAVARAEVLPPRGEPLEQGALGVTVVVRDSQGEERAYRLVSAEEHSILGSTPGNACSVQSPLGRALLGARIGEVRELRLPRGQEELEIVALRGEVEVSP